AMQEQADDGERRILNGFRRGQPDCTRTKDIQQTNQVEAKAAFAEGGKFSFVQWVSMQIGALRPRIQGRFGIGASNAQRNPWQEEMRSRSTRLPRGLGRSISTESITQ
ncbi:hypothetical protein CLAIMM_12214, partial [Cladophialophora immunda]